MQSTHVGSSLFTLTESQELLKKTCRDFAERELKPVAGDIDKKHEYPRELVREIDSRKKIQRINRSYLSR